MAFDTFIALAASYDDEADALLDYEAVKSVYSELGAVDTYDAAVLTRDDEGKVHVVKKHEQPTRQGAWGGLGIGLVGGLAIALFPAVALGGGLLVAMGGAGAGLGALAGHAAGGMSRGDLKDIGEMLDNGQSALLFVAATDMEARAEKAVTRAKKIEKKQLKADPEQVAKDVAAAKSADA